MKILGLCLAFLLGPPGNAGPSTQQADPSPGVSMIVVAQDPSPAGMELVLPNRSEFPAMAESSFGSLALNLGLTGFLILLSLYFYIISVELGREAMRRERLARRFVERGHRSSTLPPVEGYDVDQIDSLLLQDHLQEAS